MPGDNRERGHGPGKRPRAAGGRKGFEDMFFLSITRHGVARKLDAPDVREHNLGGWVVTTATDGWLSTCAVEGAAVTVTEAAPSAREEIPFVRARVSDAPLAIDLTKELVGGRQVLYHVAPDGGFYCASHVHLLRRAGVSLAEDPDVLPELFSYRYVSAPRTMFKGVRQMLAGERLRFEHDGAAWRAVKTEEFMPPQPKPGAGAAEHAERTLEVLRDAMRALGRATDPVHVLLSGGLDSSVLFKLAQDELGVTASHSTGYPFEAEADDVEKRYALTAAEAMGAGHHHFVSTTGRYLRGFLETVSIAEEPPAHLQAVLLHLLFRDGLPAGRGIIVNGEGADGLYGLQLHRQVRSAERFTGRYPRLARALRPLASPPLLPLVRSAPILGTARAVLKRLNRASDVIELVGRRWGPGVAPSDLRHVLWGMGVLNKRNRAWVCRTFRSSDLARFGGRIAMMERFRDFAVHDQLSMLSFQASAAMSQRIWSKLGEAAGKVVYYPFSARPVIDRAFETPWEQKLSEPKGLLRAAARKAGVPEFIVSRPKANFNATPARWAARGTALEPLIPLAAKAWDEADIRRWQSDGWATAHTFSAILNYAIWKRLFIHNESLGTLLGELERALHGAPQPAREPAMAGV